MYWLAVLPATLIAIPFPATYAPSPPAAMSFVQFITAFSIYGYGGAELVGRLIRNPLHWLIAAAALSAICLFFRRKRKSHWGHEPFSFAGDGDPTVEVTNFAPE